MQLMPWPLNPYDTYHFHHPSTNSPCAPSARIVSVLGSTRWHHVHRSQIVKPLSPSVNQFTMRTIRMDRQCFGVYPLAPCAPFTDRETTVTIRQPIHHICTDRPYGLRIEKPMNHHHWTNSPSAQCSYQIHDPCRIVVLDHTPKKVFLFDSV
jgi:hypothetical protein